VLTLRKAQKRGQSRRPWLESWHTFSFGDYDDPDFRGFRSLRVLNEDHVAPDSGFPLHPHYGVEIITYVLSGRLVHRDNLGNSAEMTPERVQLLKAGSGVLHSETNPSPDEPVHFLQIWLDAAAASRGQQPTYHHRGFPRSERRNRLQLLASPLAEANSLELSQDVSIFASALDSGHSLEHSMDPDRCAWIQLAHGSLVVDDLHVDPGDGVMIQSHEAIHLHASQDAEFLLFDLA